MYYLLCYCPPFRTPVQVIIITPITSFADCSLAALSCSSNLSFMVVWVSSEYTWLILSRPSYRIRQFEWNSPEYKKAIKNNILVTRAVDNIYPITNTKVNFGQDQFVIIDDNFQPFEFYSLVKNADNVYYDQAFLPLNDPNLNKLIQDHQADLHISEDGKHIYLPEIDEQIDTFDTNRKDPLAL